MNGTAIYAFGSLNLITQGWSNKAAAEDLGFTDSAHLCGKFKRMCGTTPQHYAPVYAQGS